METTKEVKFSLWHAENVRASQRAYLILLVHLYFVYWRGHEINFVAIKEKGGDLLAQGFSMHVNASSHNNQGATYVDLIY